MPVHMIRSLVDGKMVGMPIEADSPEEARRLFEGKIGKIREATGQAVAVAGPGSEALEAEPGPAPVANRKLNGRKFLGIEFQCSSCGSPLAAVFRDGYLQVDPCPTCLGEMEKIVASTKKFLERKK